MKAAQDSQAPFVEIVAQTGLKTYVEAWRALCAAAEPNIFAAPEFVIPALAAIDPKGQVSMVFIWSDSGRQKMIAAIALTLPRSSLGVARVWQCEQAGMAAMVMAQAAPPQALGGFLEWLKPQAAVLEIPSVLAGSAILSSVNAYARQARLAMNDSRARQRAALGPAQAAGFESRLDKKRLKEWARLARRLRDKGALVYRVSTAAEDIETFLKLEASGWKGRRGTAFGATQTGRRFAGAVISAFLESGALAFHRLDLDNKPIAIGVVITARDKAFYWKTAFDEALAPFSPGVLLTLELSRQLERQDGLSLVDGCAIEGHPMIDRLWSQRITLIDLALSTRPGRAAPLAFWSAVATISAQARGVAKRAINPLLGRKTT